MKQKDKNDVDRILGEQSDFVNLRITFMKMFYSLKTKIHGEG